MGAGARGGQRGPYVYFRVAGRVLGLMWIVKWERFQLIPGGGAYSAAMAGGALEVLARSQARHRYQLATERNGLHFWPRLNSTSGLGRSVTAIGRVLGTRMKVSA